MPFALFLSVVSPSKAQYQDYIILQSGEKLEGGIKGEKNKQVKFKKDGDKKFIKYKPQQVREYYTSKKQATHFSAVLPKSSNPEFLLCEERGAINLLRHKVNRTYMGAPIMGAGGMMMTPGVGFSSPNVHYYAQKGDKPLVELNSNDLFKASKAKRKEKLSELLSDEPDILEELSEERKFNNDIIREYIVKYNLKKKGSLPTF